MFVVVTLDTLGTAPIAMVNSIVFFYFFSSVMKITKILQLWHAEFKSDDKNSHRVTIYSCLLQGIL